MSGLRRGCGYVLALLAVGAVAYAQSELTLRDAVERALLNDTSFKSAQIDLAVTERDYRLKLDEVLPSVELSLTPLKYDRRRITTVRSAPKLPSESWGVGLGVTVTQLLPTSGVAVLTLNNQTDWTELDGKRSIGQSPALQFILNQPLSGGLGPDSVFQAQRRAARVGLDLQRLGTQAQRNASTIGAVESFLLVGRLRSSVDILERSVALLAEDLADAELDREQGILSEEAVLRLRAALDDQREALFDTRLALLAAEQGLSERLGFDPAGSALIYPPPAIDLVTVVTKEQELDLAANATITARALQVSQAGDLARINDLDTSARIELSLRLAPGYPDTRSGDDFAASIGDLFTAEAHVATTAGATVTVPVFTRRERRIRRELDELSIRRARTQLAQTERSAQTRAAGLTTARDFLAERLEIVAVDIALRRRALADERALLLAGGSTERAVLRTAVDLDRSLADRDVLRDELLLNELQTRDLRGEDLSRIVATW